MPRRPRSTTLADIVHVTSRGNRRAHIYLDDVDHTLFWKLFDREAARRGWVCVGYCLMDNHFHVVLDQPRELSEGMQRLKSEYAAAFNGRHSVDGHLFQGRFACEPVENEWHMLEVCRYVVLNPVRAGICRHPGEWKWSSYRATIGQGAAPACFDRRRLLGLFGTDIRRATQRFAAFVADGIPRSSR